MVASRITKRFVDALPVTGRRYAVWDRDIPGYGVRVGAKLDAKDRPVLTYVFKYRVGGGRAGRQKMAMIGRHGPLTPDQARETAKDWYAEVRQGGDPAGARKDLREGCTIADLVADYVRYLQKRGKRSAHAVEQNLSRDVLPPLGGRLATSVQRADIVALIDGIVKRGSPVAANRVREQLRRAYNLGIKNERVKLNPCALIEPEPETSRDRTLSDNEIAAFWNGLGTTNISTPIQQALKWQLITAQRRSEVAAAQWAEIDEDNAVWTILAERSKNGLAHRVPLSASALDLLVEARSMSGDTPWLFPSPRSDGPVTAGAITYALRRHRRKMGIDDVTPHDLRRTAATWMASLGVPRLTIGKVLNHADSGVTKIYDRFSYDVEKRHALDAWGSKLKEIVTGQPVAAEVNKVVKLR